MRRNNLLSGSVLKKNGRFGLYQPIKIINEGKRWSALIVNEIAYCERILLIR